MSCLSGRWSVTSEFMTAAGRVVHTVTPLGLFQKRCCCHIRRKWRGSFFRESLPHICNYPQRDFFARFPHHQVRCTGRYAANCYSLNRVNICILAKHKWKGMYECMYVSTILCTGTYLGVLSKRFHKKLA